MIILRELLERLETNKEVEIYEEDMTSIIIFEAAGFRVLSDGLLDRSIREWDVKSNVLSIVLNKED